MIVYHQGKTVDMFRIPIGGEHLSLAVSERFKISLEEAEALKIKQGSFSSHSIDIDEQIEAGSDGMFIAFKSFTEVLEEKIKQLFDCIRERLDSKQLLDQINSGIIWTGKTAFVPGFLELARLHTGMASSHPQHFISNDFKKTNSFTIAQTAPAQERFKTQKIPFASRWTKIRDFF